MNRTDVHNLSEKQPPPTNRGVTPGEKMFLKERRDVYSQAEVDWFTATSGSDRLGFLWRELMSRYEKTLAYADLERREWSRHGYNGTSLPGFQWGYHRQHGYIIICSGPIAERFWLEALAPRPRVTRLDLSVTVDINPPEPFMADRLYREGQAQGLFGNLSTTVVENSRGGNTLYLGSRSSDQYGRLYDKGVEADPKGGEQGKFWRYEVEFKKPRSSVVAGTLMTRMKDGSLPADLILSTVHDWFLVRGVRPLFRPGATPALVTVVSQEYRETSLDRKIKWLRTSVQPTVKKLLAMGMEEETLRALGIPRQLSYLEDG